MHLDAGAVHALAPIFGGFHPRPATQSCRIVSMRRDVLEDPVESAMLPPPGNGGRLPDSAGSIENESRLIRTRNPKEKRS